MHRSTLLLVALAAIAVPTAANAGELFGGLYVHDVKTPLDKSGIEGGMDVMIGWRGEKIARTPLQPYAFAAVNTSGNTNYGAVGLSAKFGDRIYFRPGLGIAVHTGSSGDRFRHDKIAFGSRFLFEPEVAIGARLSDRATIEASWVHMSHAQVFGRENPGIDNFGVRLNFRL